MKSQIDSAKHEFIRSSFLKALKDAVEAIKEETAELKEYCRQVAEDSQDDPIYANSRCENEMHEMYVNDDRISMVDEACDKISKIKLPINTTFQKILKSLFSAFVVRSALFEENLNVLFSEAIMPKVLKDVLQNKEFSESEKIEFIQAYVNSYEPTVFLFKEKTTGLAQLLETRYQTVNELLKKILKSVNDERTAYALCKNASVLTHYIKEFEIDSKQIEYFNAQLSEDFFECVRKNHTKNKELLELVDCYDSAVHTKYADQEKTKLFKMLMSSERAKSKFKEILNTHLENDFDFNSLMSYLKKVEKKNLLNV